MGESAATGTIEVREAITELEVSDLARSRAWYSRLFGKGPDLEPFPGNIEFKLGGAWLQIVQGEVRPTSWSLQLEVRDLPKEQERLRAVGVAATEIKTVPDVIRFFDVRDPDGYHLRLFQVMTDDPKVTGGRD
jgi:glyoxylase I family protein